MDIVDWLKNLLNDADSLIRQGGSVAIVALVLFTAIKARCGLAAILMMTLAAALVSYVALLGGLEDIATMLGRSAAPK